MFETKRSWRSKWIIFSVVVVTLTLMISNLEAQTTAGSEVAQSPAEQPSPAPYISEFDAIKIIPKLTFGMTLDQVKKKIGHEHQVLGEDAVAVSRNFWQCAPIMKQGRPIPQALGCIGADGDIQLAFYRGALYFHMARCDPAHTCGAVSELFTKRYGRGVPYVEALEYGGGTRAIEWRQGSNRFQMVGNTRVQCIDGSLVPPSLRSSLNH